jgi:hypothetical protein
MHSSRALDPQRVAPYRHIAHPFDLHYGLDTGGYLAPQQIVTGHPHDALGFGYSAIAPSVFREACRRWRDRLTSAAAVKAYTFVDVGAGKARALFLASAMPFRKVVGIELSPELAGIAQHNAAHWRAMNPNAAPIRVLHRDVLQAPLPRPPLLVYLYNPFDCWLIEKLLDRIDRRLMRTAASGARHVDMLYINPICAEVLGRRRGVSLLWTGRIDMDEADRAADPYGTTFDRVSIYRLRS